MPVADGLYRAWYNVLLLLRGAMAQLCQAPGDLLICVALLKELDNQPLHLLGSGKIGQRADRSGNLKRRGLSTLPHDTRQDQVGGDPTDYNLLDQAAHQSLFLLLRDKALIPNLG
jgi:hypothetical protein